MKHGRSEFMLKYAWAAAALAVVATGAKNVLEDELPQSQAQLGHHEHGRHHHMRRTAAAVDINKGLSPRVVQHEIEQMAMRADRLATKDLAAATKVQAQLQGVEAALVTRVGSDTALADEIRAVRAQLCSKKGFLSHQSRDCEAFMWSSCFPNTQQADEADEAEEDAAPSRPMVPAALCQRYWGNQAFLRFAEAPAAAPAMSPAAAPAPAPTSSEDFFKYGKEGRALPEQGFHGDLVEHPDQDTQTSDWQQEFGPNSGHRTYREICAERPNNRWCKIHLKYLKHRGHMPPGWGPRPEKSSALSRSGHLVLTVAATSAAVLLGAVVV